jgi:CHASE3 domain sensor protein
MSAMKRLFPFSRHAVAIMLILCSIFGTYYYGSNLIGVQSRIAVANAFMRNKERLYLSLLEAESGQRGFVLTGSDLYLDTYFTSVATIPEKLKFFETANLDADQKKFGDKITPLVNTKLAELSRTIELRRSRGFESSVAVVRDNTGRDAMSQIRGELLLERTRSEKFLAEATANVSYQTSMTIYSILLGILALIAEIGGFTRRKTTIITDIKSEIIEWNWNWYGSQMETKVDKDLLSLASKIETKKSPD